MQNALFSRSRSKKMLQKLFSFITYPERFFIAGRVLSNRQEEKDRIRAQNDYKVNIKAELIIEDLHQKLDTLIENQKMILEKMKF